MGTSAFGLQTTVEPHPSGGGRYHAVLSDSPFELVQAEGQHRDHAIVEQVFADWSDGPLAHLPSGSFPANAAWLTCAAIAHNLLPPEPWPAWALPSEHCAF